ncbi:hypothetical protein AVEN_225256-1 [Araneus ventricosus]|uniref:Uncharacterized protein n=1 Tax=Araneus ventricosus TaxID=182803 RepID=A0A4Y2AMW4_ARAVE|nr:hypothetical protein AVEN_225256-1 [Araneus ventricosus]
MDKKKFSLQQHIDQLKQVDKPFDAFFILKRTTTANESSHTVPPFLVERAVTAHLGITKSTRKLRTGDLLIQVATRKQAQQIIQRKCLDNIPVAGSHTSFSRLCSAWKFEKEVIAEKVKKDVSFREARRLVKSRAPAPRTSYATVVRKTPETTKTQILPTILPSVPFKTSYIPSEICPKSPESFLNFSAINTRIETVSFQPKVPERSKDPPDFSDFKTVTHKEKFKKVSQVNQNNITVDKVSQYYKPPQLTDKEPSEASNSVIKQNNITVINSGTKSPHVCSVGPVPESMAAFPPEKTKVLQSLESDADAEMICSSASEGDTLEYDMSKDLEDTPQNVCPTTLPPPSIARKR